MSQDRKYCSFPIGRIDSIDYNCFETNRGGVTICDDGSEFLVSFLGDPPECIGDLDTFTRDQIRAKYKDPDDLWFQRNPDMLRFCEVDADDISQQLIDQSVHESVNSLIHGPGDLRLVVFIGRKPELLRNNQEVAANDVVSLLQDPESGYSMPGSMSDIEATFVPDDMLLFFGYSQEDIDRVRS